MFLKIGQRIGPYRIDDILPEGGEAVVVRAVNGRHKFVLKSPAIPPEDPASESHAQRFRGVATIRVGHPNVVDPVGLLEHEGRPVLVLPYIDGVDLEAHLQRRGSLPVPEALSITGTLADALTAVHERGIVHRDVKPSNIIIDPGGEPRLTDFGIALLPGTARSAPNGTVGTPPWLAPEQRRDADSVDHRADLYSLGAVLLYASTGARPPDGPDPRRLVPAGLPEPAATVIARALAPDPDDRYRNAGEMLAAIRAPFCPACGAPGVPDAQFCRRCGTPAREPAPQTPRCLACAAELSDGADRCPGCARPFGRARHRLRFSGGPLRGRVFLIPEGAFEVGRRVLGGDRAVSRRHAAITCINGSVSITDLGSANGTRVNGRPAATPTQLDDGARVVLAHAATFTRRTDR